MKKVFVVVGFIIIAILVLRTVLLSKSNNELTYTVKQEDLVDTIQASGTYTTALQKAVLSPAKGVITQLYVVNKQEVKKGTPLFHVESTATEDEKAIAYADYQEAVSKLKVAEQAKKVLDAAMWTKQQAVLDNQNDKDFQDQNTTNPTTGNDFTYLEKRSLESGVTQAKKDFEAAEQQYKEADITIAAAQAKVKSTKLAYDETRDITVVAPANGTVFNFLKKVGDEITTTNPVLVIANLDNPSITAVVNEAYASRVEPGQKATVVFDSLKDKVFEGSVEDIDTVGTDTQGIITYRAKINVPDLPSTIRPNMTAIVTIETLKKEHVLTVPNSAVIKKDGKTYVKKVNGNTTSLLEVTVGIRGTTKTEITSGLEEGDVVIANATE